MKGYKINPDSKHVDLIIEGLLKKDGYCPCKVQKSRRINVHVMILFRQENVVVNCG